MAELIHKFDLNKEKVEEHRKFLKRYYDSNLIKEMNRIEKTIKRKIERYKIKDIYFDLTFVCYYDYDLNKFFVKVKEGKKERKEAYEGNEKFMERNGYAPIGFFTFEELYYNINLREFLEEVQWGVMEKYENIFGPK